MKKILIYGKRVEEPCVWDVSTPEQEKEAFSNLFRLLDSQGVYSYLAKPEHPGMSEEEVGSLPDGSIKDKALEELVAHEKRLVEFERLIPSGSRLYEKAKTGNDIAIRKLLDLRKERSGEQWGIHSVEKSYLLS